MRPVPAVGEPGRAVLGLGGGARAPEVTAAMGDFTADGVGGEERAGGGLRLFTEDEPLELLVVFVLVRTGGERPMLAPPVEAVRPLELLVEFVLVRTGTGGERPVLAPPVEAA